MHKIDVSGAVEAMPAPSESEGTAGYFTEGNAATSQEATPVSADWLNAVQSELVNVIEAAGIELEKTSQTQLLAAISALIAAAVPDAPDLSTCLLKANNLSDVSSLSVALSNLGFSSSLSSNGYQKIPGGLILQWGSGTTNASGILSVTLPTTYPSTHFATVGISVSSTPSEFTVSDKSLSGFTARTFHPSTESVDDYVPFNWFSVGK
ncbi:MAG: hypothetical protein AB7S81_08340 [Bdellovibrionales bacterium]